MATSVVRPQVLLLYIIILLICVTHTSSARIPRQFLGIQLNPNVHKTLTKLGFDDSQLEYYRRRARLNAIPTRVAPAGPDPIHRYKSPPKF